MTYFYHVQGKTDIFPEDKINNFHTQMLTGI